MDVIAMNGELVKIEILDCDTILLNGILTRVIFVARGTEFGFMIKDKYDSFIPILNPDYCEIGRLLYKMSDETIDIFTDECILTNVCRVENDFFTVGMCRSSYENRAYINTIGISIDTSGKIAIKLGNIVSAYTVKNNHLMERLRGHAMLKIGTGNFEIQVINGRKYYF